MNSDFKDLLSVFAKHQVRYFVAGGYAVKTLLSLDRRGSRICRAE